MSFLTRNKFNPSVSLKRENYPQNKIFPQRAKQITAEMQFPHVGGKVIICENCLGKRKAHKDPLTKPSMKGPRHSKERRLKLLSVNRTLFHPERLALIPSPPCHFCLPTAEHRHQADITRAQDGSASFSGTALISSVITFPFQRLSALSSLGTREVG